MAGTFDPNLFLDQTTTEAGSTQIVPIPVGEYNAVIDDIEIRPWTSQKDPSKSGIALDVKWMIDSPEVREFLQRDQVIAKQGIMIDLTEDGHGLDWGKGRNVGLGRLREALGLNKPGEPFSFRMLKGRVAKVSIKHRVEGENIYNDVAGVARMA